MHVVCVWCTCVHTQSTSALPPEMGWAACSVAHTWRHKKTQRLLHKTNIITQNKHKMLLHKTNTITQTQNVITQNKHNYTKQTQNVTTQNRHSYTKQTQMLLLHVIIMLTWQLCFVHYYCHISAQQDSWHLLQWQRFSWWVVVWLCGCVAGGSFCHSSTTIR